MFRDQPKNLVQFDAEKKPSIRTFAAHRGKQDTFKLGWDVQQKADGLTNKIGSNTQQSFIPQHTIQTNPKYGEIKNNILTQNGTKVAQGYANYANGEFALRQQQSITPPSQPPPQPKIPSYEEWQEQQQYGGQQYDEPAPQYGGYQQQQYQQNAIYNQEPQQNKVYQQSNEIQGEQLNPQGYVPVQKQVPKRNQSSNIFNTDLQSAQEYDDQSQQSRKLNKKNQEIQNKGYGSFYNRNDNGQYVGIPRQQINNRNQGPSSVFNK